MSGPSMTRMLQRLALLYGVQTAYYDVAHKRHQAGTDALVAVLESLGASVATVSDAPRALREHQQALWQRALEPVLVTWAGEPLQMTARFPLRSADRLLVGHLTLETGERQRYEWRGSDLAVTEAAEIERTPYMAKRITLPQDLPLGYHRFTLEVDGRLAEALVVVAPVRAYSPMERGRERTWGVFLPLYALYTYASWGAGDLSALEALMTWVDEQGGGVVATLPLLASFLDEPLEPSPYAPVSRLLWNEFYLDAARVPELERCPPAQALLESASFQEEIDALRGLSLVDYRRQMALKRRVLEELCRCCFAEASDRLVALQRFSETEAVTRDYACFRAACEKQRSPWPSWPHRLRQGALKDGDYDEDNKRYHLYVQWLAREQVHDLSRMARDRNLRLYLDFPLGVHPDGYDVWRHRDVFASNVLAGAPPDAVFTKGQNWRFPPHHPQQLREQGYSYYIACLRHHLRHARILRIDHVMSLHRLFWIPSGMEASQGVYVRYPAEELYAILALESQRHGAIVVGEDLGTVPPQVRPAMSCHGLRRMYVVQYELDSNPSAPLQAVFPRSVASLNTHDMPTFPAFWHGADIEQRAKLGLVDRIHRMLEEETRQTTAQAVVRFLRQRGWISTSPANADEVLRGCLAFLGASPASVVLVNLEDLWGETRPQNVPGAQEEYPNWRRKARYALEELCQLPQVINALRELNQTRSHGGS